MPGIELIITFVAGAIVFPAAFVGLSLVFRILDARDRGKAFYTHASSVGFMDVTPDLVDHPVRIEKIRKGYRVRFYKFNDDGDPSLVKTVILEKLDRPPLD